MATDTINGSLVALLRANNECAAETVNDAARMNNGVYTACSGSHTGTFLFTWPFVGIISKTFDSVLERLAALFLKVKLQHHTLQTCKSL